MRVLHVIEDFSRLNTGVTATVRALATWQRTHCEWVGVYATGPVEPDLDDALPVFADALLPASRGWRFPRGGSSTLESLVRTWNVELLHVHGLWRAAPLLAGRVARRHGLPWVLSVHGQCSPWALYGQGLLKQWKKQAYWSAIARAPLSRCTALHAITPPEAEHLARFFDGRSADAVIPNALNAAPGPAPEPAIAEPYFLFLGRLHPVKAIDRLIEAFARGSIPGPWRVVIAGPEEDPAYAAALRAQVARHSADSRIEFIGPVYGQRKAGLLAQAWAVIVPSHTEVVGMANLEAAWASTPSITTTAAGLHDWQAGGGMLVDGSVDALRDALVAATGWTSDERMARGKASRGLVSRRYILDAVGPQWLALYDSLVSR
ncbi:MAG: glycosyltransferase [Burkholderiales bacterium]